MNSVAPPSLRPLERPAAVSGARLLTVRVFFAALGPMITVPALRRLVMDVHGASPAALHVFVAVGMIGAAIGAPLVAARADGSGEHARLAAAAAAIDAIITLASISTSSTVALFVLRPLHGMASMALLALLFGDLRRVSKRFVAHAGGAMILALAVGPALGGALSHAASLAPFEAAALVSALLSVSFAAWPIGEDASPSTRAPAAQRARRGDLRALATRLAAPLLLLGTQRLAVGGFVAAFAVRARAAGVSDARIGVSFSVFLVVFAATVIALGRMKSARPTADGIPLGGLLFGAGFVVLALTPARHAMPLLAIAGVGAGMVYAPCLAIASSASESARSASTMALVHAAGAVGMIVGPLAAALVDVGLPTMTPAGRSTMFLVLAASLQMFAGVALHAQCRALERSEKNR